MAFSDPCSEFWSNLDNLTSQLRLIENASESVDAQSLVENDSRPEKTLIQKRPRTEIIAAIESAALKLIKELVSGTPLSFQVKGRKGGQSVQTSSQRGYKLKSLPEKVWLSIANIYSLRKFVVMVKVLSICYSLIQADKFATKRELFYLHVNLFKSQRPVDDALIDLSCLLQIPRSNLHVMASTRGSIMGCLQFLDENGNALQCNGTKEGIPVPTFVNQISELSSEAKYILVVEKEAIYQKLADEGFARSTTPCIIITGRGFPDINTRLMLRKLWSSLRIPIFGLVDADPHGIEIMCVYRYGSIALSYDSNNLTCAPLRWLGIHPADVERFAIPNSVLIPLTNHDRRKLQCILQRPLIKEDLDLSAQIKTLLQADVKGEIECLDAISPSFLTSVYLPYKIRSGSWI